MKSNFVYYYRFNRSPPVFFFLSFLSSHLQPMVLIITFLPVVTKDLPISPRFTPYNFLSRCKFSTLTTRQPMVEFYLLTFPSFPLRKKEHKSYFGKNRTHDFRTTSRCAAYLLLDHPGDILFSFFCFSVRKIPFAGIELTSQRVRGYMVSLSYRGDRQGIPAVFRTRQGESGRRPISCVRFTL